MAKKRSEQGRRYQENPKPAQPLRDRRLMERESAKIGRWMRDQDFESIDEANKLLQEKLESGGIPDIPLETPLEKAQELVYQALEVEGTRRTRLARNALEVSPDCADAYVILAEEADDLEEAMRLYEQGVRAGERALGPEWFGNEVGNFWGPLETRPYMRARQGLVETLWEFEDTERAIEHAQDMLRLNPNDNQGMRYMLVELLLEAGRDDEVEKLLDEYDEEEGTEWAYTRALLTFRRHGRGTRADRALKRAFDVNHLVPVHLLSVARIINEEDDELNDLERFGDSATAASYLADSAKNWVQTPGALEWFLDTLDRDIKESTPTKLRTVRMTPPE